MARQDEEFDFVRTGPGTLAGRYLRSFWQPVYLTKVLRAGSAVPLRVMGEDFTLYRGETGEAHLVAAYCPHRLTRLSIGRVEGDSIRCRYHGWRFEGSGACVEQPGEPAPFCQKVPIASYPVKEHLGLVFAYLGEGEPPPFPLWPLTDEVVQAYDCTPTRAAKIPCNYFQSAENILDDTHVPFVHGNHPMPAADFPDAGGFRSGVPRIKAEEKPFGLTQFVHHQDRAEDDPNRVTQFHFMLPNTCHLWVPELTKTILYWYVPIDDTSHYHFVVYLPPHKPQLPVFEILDFSAEVAETLAGRKAFDTGDAIRLQDAVVICGQGAIAPRVNERLGQADAAIILLRKLWRRELRAFSNGEPARRFAVSPELDATSRIRRTDFPG